MDQRPLCEELQKQINALQTEIDELRSATGAVEASEALHRITLENISDTVIITDDHGRIIYACPNTFMIFGLSQDQVYERGTIQALIGGNACDLSELRKAKEISNIEWTVPDQSGRRRFVLITAKSVSIQGGSVLYVMRDITERKKMEQELALRERECRTLLESIPDFVVRYDPDLRRTYVNSAWEKASGLSAAEVVNVPHTDIPRVPVPAADEYVEKLRQVLGTGAAQAIEFTWVNADGARLFLDYLIVPEFDPCGKISGLLAVGRDITGRKQTEEALRKSEKKWRNILVNIPQIGVSLDSQAKIVFANKHFLKLTGWEQEEIIGKNWFDLFIPENNRAAVRSVFRAIMEQNDLLDYSIYENDILLKTGETRNVDWFNVLTRDARGDIVDVTCLGVDLTEQRVAEKEKRESEEKYRSMMESFVEPLYICSPNFTVEYLNPAMIRRIGRDATGERCYSALHGLDAKCNECVFDQVLRGEKVETTIKSPLDQRDYRVTHMPLKDQNGTISKMTIFRDITDYLQAVSEKEKAQAYLMHAEKMEAIGTLAGGIAHDFNNILSSIIGFAELALDEVKKGTTLEDSLQEVHAAGKRAKELVNQILAFARQADEEKSPVQPARIAKEVLKFIRSAIPATIAIRQEIASDALIMGDATQVHRVLMNLCTNAAQAMEDTGGVLTVGLQEVSVDKRHVLRRVGLKPGDYIEIAVSDTGVGIAPDNIGSIFEPYFTTKVPGEGTGMGLAMVHGIVESYGGKITVESRLGKGATFKIYLPVTGKRSAGGPHASEQLPSGAERILFVDDELTITKMSSKILAQLGYSVTTRTSSIEALELFRAKPDAFDLVITDMTMPNLTGDELAIELMKIRPDIPVILSTGYSKKMSDETASEIGIKAFAYKPMVKADLAKTVRKVLDDARPQG
jgi:PAS domain S-box-containing protein